MMESNAERLDRATKLIKKAWPPVISFARPMEMEDDAVGALAYHLDQAQREGQDPVALLRSVNKTDLAWSIEEANHPAAFLARRVSDAR